MTFNRRYSGRYFGLSADHIVLLALLLITCFRLGVIALSPLEPSVDEAQYWLWGQDLQFGYYSKPPLIAWMLGFADWVGGQSLLSLRGGAPLLHLCTALCLYHIGREMLNPLCGRLACLIWISMPAVRLGSFIMSTDTVMLPFWCLGLYALMRACQSDPHVKQRGVWMLAAGGAIGLGSLGKYAALYFVLCMLIWLVGVCRWRASIRVAALGLFMAGLGLASAPTWVWNFTHEFVTFMHLSENANWQNVAPHDTKRGGNLLVFWGAQLGVFGPVMLMGLIIMSLFSRFSRPPAASHAHISLLHCFIWPILGLVSAQAFISEANANWAVSAYPAASLLLAYWFAQSSTKGWAILGLGLNFSIAFALSFILAVGHLGPLTPRSDPLRHLRGWDSLATKTYETARQYGAPTIVAYNRRSIALLYWYLGKNLEPDMQITLAKGGAGKGNHYHRTYPLAPHTPRPLLVLTQTPTPPLIPQALTPHFRLVGRSVVPISGAKTRAIFLWLGE